MPVLGGEVIYLLDPERQAHELKRTDVFNVSGQTKVLLLLSVFHSSSMSHLLKSIKKTTSILLSILVPPPEKKDTVLRQVRLDPCDLQPIFDDMLHILNPEELHVIEEIPAAEDKLDRLFEIAGVKSQEASQTLLDSVYSHLPDLL